MLEVINEVHPRQERVQDHDGNWSTLRITLYRTLDNRIDGVVLTLLNTDDNGSTPDQKRRKPAKSGE